MWVLAVITAAGAAAIALGVFGAFTAGEGEGVLEIDVLGPDGRTPDDYQISFSPPADGALRRTATGYEYFGVPAGRYAVTVTAPGLAPTTLEIDVVPGETRRHTVELHEATAADDPFASIVARAFGASPGRSGL